MRRRWIVAAVVGAIAAGALLVAGAAGAAEVADGYSLFLGALAMIWLVGRTRRASGADVPSAFDAAIAARRATRPSRPATLERVEREVVLSSASAFDLQVNAGQAGVNLPNLGLRGSIGANAAAVATSSPTRVAVVRTRCKAPRFYAERLSAE